MSDFDLIVVGGGILGLAAAREFSLRQPDAAVCVLERESRPAAHQSGHNSGVLHAGVYYEAGSLKARLCSDGRARLERFCRERELPFRRAGKLILATREEELPRLDRLEERARENGVPGLRRIGPEAIRAVEPNVTGIAALHSPETGIIDFSQVSAALVEDLREGGREVRFNREVLDLESGADGVTVSFTETPEMTNRLNAAGSQTTTGDQTLTARRVLCCAGAWADRLAVGSGGTEDPRILPFRGTYLQVRPERQDLIRGMVYPVPDPGLPFLGVHLTRHLDGSLSIGPTALLAGSLTATRPWSIRPRDAWRTATWPGTLRMAWRFRNAAGTELLHALSRRSLLAEARRFLPELTAADVEPGFAGIRAQAVHRSGDLADDFIFSGDERVLHVRNAPSPGATSSLAIAAHLADRLDSLPAEELRSSQQAGGRAGDR